MQEARQGWRYDYMIYMDDDVLLSKVRLNCLHRCECLSTINCDVLFCHLQAHAKQPAQHLRRFEADLRLWQASHFLLAADLVRVGSSFHFGHGMACSLLWACRSMDAMTQAASATCFEGWARR